jgi:hypothetical protein
VLYIVAMARSDLRKTLSTPYSDNGTSFMVASSRLGGVLTLSTVPCWSIGASEGGISRSGVSSVICGVSFTVEDLGGKAGSTPYKIAFLRSIMRQRAKKSKAVTRMEKMNGPRMPNLPNSTPATGGPINALERCAQFETSVMGEYIANIP